MVKQPDVTSLLESALRVASLRQTTIASNIANMGTPNFRRSAVEFEKALDAAMRNGSVDPSTVAPTLIHPGTTEVDEKGNDVNIDLEVGDMVKNDAMYKTYMRLLAKKYHQIDMVVQG